MSDRKSSGLKTIGLTALSILGGVYFSRKAIGYLSRKAMYPILTDQYDENLWELPTVIQRVNPNVLMEIELRAQTNDFI